MIMSQTQSCHFYNFGEEDPNYNNRSVRNYAYSSFKNLECCYVKKYTGIDLVLNSDSHPNAKLMLPCHPNDFKLKPNLLSGVKDHANEEHNYDELNSRNGNSVQTCKPKYNKLVLNKKRNHKL